MDENIYELGVVDVVANQYNATGNTEGNENDVVEGEKDG